MERFVNLLNSKDARWILDVDELPEVYEGEDLKPIVDAIMLEDEKLSGSNYYSDFIYTESFKIKDEAKMICLTAYQMLINNKMTEDAERVKKAAGLKVNSWEDADRLVIRIQQKIAVAEMRKLCPTCGGKDKDCKDCKGTGKKEQEKLNYGAMVANLVYYLKITPYPMTVAQYRQHEIQVKQLTNTK